MGLLCLLYRHTPNRLKIVWLNSELFTIFSPDRINPKWTFAPFFHIITQTLFSLKRPHMDCTYMNAPTRWRGADSALDGIRISILTIALAASAHAAVDVTSMPVSVIYEITSGAVIDKVTTVWYYPRGLCDGTSYQRKRVFSQCTGHTEEEECVEHG